MKMHRCPIQIRFSDIDKMGHINNAKYLTYSEYARVQYFHELTGDTIKWSERGIILARAELDFVSPGHMHDDIFVETWCSRIGNSSFDLTFKIVKKVNSADVLLAQGKTVMVCFDYKNNKTFPVPEEWKKLFV